MSQYLYSSRLTTCLPKVTSELSSCKETTLGNGALRQKGATFACFRLGEVSLMFSTLSAFCRIYKCIPDSAQDMSVGIKTDSVILRFIHFTRTKHINFITHSKHCSEPVVSEWASSLTSRAKFCFIIHQTLSHRDLPITGFVQNVFDLDRNRSLKNPNIYLHIYTAQFLAFLCLSVICSNQQVVFWSDRIQTSYKIIT